jgi:hypothetical protein
MSLGIRRYSSAILAHEIAPGPEIAKSALELVGWINIASASAMLHISFMVEPHHMTEAV